MLISVLHTFVESSVVHAPVRRLVMLIHAAPRNPIDSSLHCAHADHRISIAFYCQLLLMADDIADSVLERQHRFNINPTGVAECLVDTGKTVVPWGLGHVDDPKVVSKLLVREVREKCMPLEIFFDPESGTVSVKTGHAQGGFIRCESIQTSPGGSSTHYSVFAITAKHNLRRVSDLLQQVHRPYMAHFRVTHGLARFDSPDLDWVPKLDDRYDLRAGVETRPAVLEFGIDISVGSLITNPSDFVTGKNKSFSRVRTDPTTKAGYEPKKGQKVGMAVWFPDEAKPTTKTVAGALEDEVDITDAQLKAIYGKPGQVNIYTGEILYVGKDFIEYNINSFTGCSGAVVFLLDVNQPDSVDQSDYGKAIAIHSGAHPVIGDRNVGFLINSHPLVEAAHGTG